LRSAVGVRILRCKVRRTFLPSAISRLFLLREVARSAPLNRLRHQALWSESLRAFACGRASSADPGQRVGNGGERLLEHGKTSGREKQAENANVLVETAGPRTRSLSVWPIPSMLAVRKRFHQARSCGRL